MESVIGIIVLVMAGATIAVAVGPGAVRSSLGRFIPGLDPRHFSCRMYETEESRLTLHFGICGRIFAPRPHVETVIRVGLRDITNGAEPKGILTRNPVCQKPDSLEFAYEMENGPLPSKVSILKDWVDFFEIPVEDLVFPRQGYRTLEACVSVIAKDDRKVLAEARSQVLTLSEQPGYEAIQQNRNARRRSVIQLVAAVWSLCGRLDSDRGVVAKRLEERFGSPAASEADSIGAILDSTAGKSEHFIILEACERIREVARPSECIEALTLCLETVAAAEVISEEVSQILGLVADKLGVSRQRFHLLRQKILSGHSHKMADPRHLLGIDDSMTEEEVIRQLTTEYRKWNARVTHADDTVRRRADRMLNLIMDLRSQYQHCG